jgi:hypothetical protein
MFILIIILCVIAIIIMMFIKEYQNIKLLYDCLFSSNNASVLPIILPRHQDVKEVKVLKEVKEYKNIGV